MSTAAKREPLVLGTPRAGWKPRLDGGYKPHGAPLFDKRPAKPPRPVEVGRPAPRTKPDPGPKKKPLPPHRSPEALAVIPSGFGAQIKAARLELGLSVARAAALWGMGDKTLYRWESANGALSVEADRSRRVCSALRLEVPAQ